MNLKKFAKDIRQVAEAIRALMRARQGLSIDEPSFSGLLDIKDIRERTRVNVYEVYGHSYMRLLEDVGGDEWEIMGKVADMEDHYLISKDGEQRREAIMMTKAKTEVRMLDQPLTLQKVDTSKPLEKEEKKGFWRRGKKDNA